MKFINSIAKTFWRFLTKKLRLENGAKECIVYISARAFQRVFTCKNRRRYSRERAPRSLGELIQYYSIVSLAVCCRRFGLLALSAYRFFSSFRVTFWGVRLEQPKDRADRSFRLLIGKQIPFLKATFKGADFFYL